MGCAGPSTLGKTEKGEPVTKGGAWEILGWQDSAVLCGISVKRLWCEGGRQGPPWVSRGCCPEPFRPRHRTGRRGFRAVFPLQPSCQPSSSGASPHVLCCQGSRSEGQARRPDPLLLGSAALMPCLRVLPEGLEQLQGTQSLSCSGPRKALTLCSLSHQASCRVLVVEDLSLEVEGGKGSFKCVSLEMVGPDYGVTQMRAMCPAQVQ